MTALIALTPGSASADQDPVGGLLGQLQKETAKVLAPSAAKATPADSDLPGNETEDPTGPDHGSANVVSGAVGDQKLAEVGSNNATVEDDDSTKADSTLLSLGGQEVLGSHANSSGENESHFGDPLKRVCDGSDGAVCLQVLYADAFATDDGTTSHSESRSGIMNACLGGTDTDPSTPCGGPINVGVANSEGQAERDQNSGRTTAGSSSSVADLCVQPDPVTGGCSVRADALGSEGDADSGGAQSDADRGSLVAGVELGGKELGPISDPTDLSIQPACADPSLACVFLNQGESYIADSTGGHAQDALRATVLPGALDAFAGVSHSETLAHNAGGREAAVEVPADVAGTHKADSSSGVEASNAVSDAALSDAGLPNTGGIWSGLLALGLLSIAAGAFLTAYGRRGRTLTA